jgi:hypothetical protein
VNTVAGPVLVPANPQPGQSFQVNSCSPGSIGSLTPRSDSSGGSFTQISPRNIAPASATNSRNSNTQSSPKEKGTGTKRKKKSEADNNFTQVTQQQGLTVYKQQTLTQQPPPIALFTDANGNTTGYPTMLQGGFSNMLPFQTFIIAGNQSSTQTRPQQMILSSNVVMQPTTMQVSTAKGDPLPIQPAPTPVSSVQVSLQSTNQPHFSQATTFSNIGMISSLPQFLQTFQMQPTVLQNGATTFVMPPTFQLPSFSAQPMGVGPARVFQTNPAHGVLPTGPNQPVIQTITNGGLGQKYVLQPGSTRPFLAPVSSMQTIRPAATLHFQSQPQIITSSSGDFNVTVTSSSTNVKSHNKTTVVDST